jgi:phosphate transport system substrate-binding protein
MNVWLTQGDLGVFMLNKWRNAIIVSALILLSVLISACGGTSTGSSSSSSTPTTSSSSSSTPSSSGSSSLYPSGAYTCVTGNLTASGSTALQPLVSAVAKDYQAKCSGSTITVNLGGSGTGLSQAENGSVQIGNSDIFKKSAQPDLVDHQVAIVVFGLIVNSKVTVKNLTTAQIKSIYSGQTTNWSQVGGPNLPIVVVSRPTSSGTRATFQSYVLGGPETVQGPSNLTTDSTGTVVKNVQQTAGAIGYVALSSAKSSGLTILTIDGNDATNSSLVESNTYKFWNIEHMYTKGAATGLAQALINYMGSSDGKTEAQKLSFLNISDMQSSSLQAHQPKS